MIGPDNKRQRRVKWTGKYRKVLRRFGTNMKQERTIRTIRRIGKDRGKLE